MTEPLQVGQFAIVDHEPVDRGPNAGVFHGKGPIDDRSELYIVAEGTTPAGEAFAGHVISAAGQAWTALDMSLTGSLRRIFDEAERNLGDWNRRSIAHHRVQLGLACLGRRGGQAVIAQAGPCAAFHVSAGRLQVYTPDDEHAAPLGAGQAQPQLRRITLLPGDRLLLVSTGALAGMDDDVVAGILQLGSDQILPEIYRRVQEMRHVTVLLVSVPEARKAARPRPRDEMVIGEDAPAAIAAPAIGSGPGALAADPQEPDPFQPSLFIDDTNENVVEEAKRQLVDISLRARQAVAVPAVAADVLEPLQRAAGDNSLARLAAERQASATLAQAALQAQAVVVAGGARQPWRGHAGPTNEHTPGDSRRRHQRQSFTRGLVREEAPPAPERGVHDVPLAAEMADESRARAAVLSPVSETIAGENAATINQGGSLVRVRSNMSGRWKGGSGLSRRRSAPPAQLPPTWLVIIIGLGVLLTLVGIVTVPRILERNDSERYANLVDSAQQRIATAGAFQVDPAQRRKALTEAQALLLEARALDGAAPEAVQLLTSVNAALTAMDAVRTPAAVETIGSLEQFGEKPVAVTRMAIAADTAYLLDSASGQVIGMSLASGERKVVFGEDKEAKRGRPVAVAFLDGNDLGGPTLLILDGGRSLWALTGTNLRAIPFAAPANMTATDITVFGRDLFVLDANASQVLRFGPADGGFAAAPVKVLDTPDLAAARRLMVDQEIVTADANGQLRRFSGQVSLVLSEGGIDKRLLAPDGPYPLGKGGDLAVLDAANDRIVVLRRDGAFAGQYRHAEFKSMSAFAMRGNAAYVFSGAKLRRVTF